MPQMPKKYTAKELADQARQEQELKQELWANVHNIGKANTKYALLGARKDPATRAKINKYRAKINKAVILNDPDFKLHGHNKFLREKEIKEEEEQNRQIVLGLEGTGKIIPFLVFPFVGTMLALYRGERVWHNTLKITIALLLMAAVALAIVFLPGLSVPFIAFVGTLFGKTAALTAGIVGFGVSFNIAERILDQNQPLPDRILRIWKKNTYLEEDVVNLMQHYLHNVHQVSHNQSIKNVIRSLSTQDMLNPAPDSLQKIAMFFGGQLKKLRNERRWLESIKQKSYDADKQDLWDAEYGKVNLDIKAVTFILEQLFTITSMPIEAQNRIQEQLEDTDELRAQRKQAKQALKDAAPSAVASKPYAHLSDTKAPDYLARHNSSAYVKGEPRQDADLDPDLPQASTSSKKKISPKISPKPAGSGSPSSSSDGE